MKIRPLNDLIDYVYSNIKLIQGPKYLMTEEIFIDNKDVFSIKWQQGQQQQCKYNTEKRPLGQKYHNCTIMSDYINDYIISNLLYLKSKYGDYNK